MKKKNTINKGEPAVLEVSLSPAAPPVVRVPAASEPESAASGNGNLPECPLKRDVTVLHALFHDMRGDVAVLRESNAVEIGILRTVLEAVSALVKERNTTMPNKETRESVPKKDFYNTREAGILLCKAACTVRKNCFKGQIEAHKVPGRMHGEYRISHEEIVHHQNGGGLRD